METLVLLSCQFLLFILAGYILFSWLRTTPFYPSSPKKLQAFIEQYSIKISGDKFLDIGSGDGRFVIWASRHGYIASGVEFNPFLTLLSRFKILVFGLGKKAKIYNTDFKKYDFSEYDLVYLYIYPEYMNQIKNRLFTELKPGSVIISNTFTFSDLKPDLNFDRYKVYYIK